MLTWASTQDTIYAYDVKLICRYAKTGQIWPCKAIKMHQINQWRSQRPLKNLKLTLNHCVELYQKDEERVTCRLWL